MWPQGGAAGRRALVWCLLTSAHLPRARDMSAPEAHQLGVLALQSALLSHEGRSWPSCVALPPILISQTEYPVLESEARGRLGAP